MRRILAWIIAALYIVVGASVTAVMAKCNPMIAEFHAGRQIEYSFMCLCLLTSPSYVWLLLSIFLASALLVFANKTSGPSLNIAFGVLLLAAIIMWLSTFMGLLFPHAVIVE